MSVSFNLPIPLGTFAKPGSEVSFPLHGFGPDGRQVVLSRLVVDLGTATSRVEPVVEGGFDFTEALAGPGQVLSRELAQDGDKEICLEVRLHDLDTRFTVSQPGYPTATANSIAEVLELAPGAVVMWGDS